MGWRNMFINLTKGKKDCVSTEDFEKFLDHHNNYYNHFDKETLKEINDKDEIPGEDIDYYKVIIQEINAKKNYWLYFGNHGGSGHTIAWQERYFPDIKIYDSCTFRYEGWQSWPLITYEEFKKIKQ